VDGKRLTWRDGARKKQIAGGNDRKKSKSKGKCKYSGPSLRSRMTRVWALAE
jgi:hypothetical protein